MVIFSQTVVTPYKCKPVTIVFQARTGNNQIAIEDICVHSFIRVHSFIINSLGWMPHGQSQNKFLDGAFFAPALQNKLRQPLQCFFFHICIVLFFSSSTKQNISTGDEHYIPVVIFDQLIVASFLHTLEVGNVNALPLI